MPASKSLPLGPPTRTRTTSKARGRATFDAATADSALRAKSEYSAFIADRRVKVCSAKDPKAFAADPTKFVYTAEHCHTKGVKGAKSSSTSNKPSPSSDDTEIRQIQTILENQFPKIKNGRKYPTKTPRDEVDIPHETILMLTGFMMMPYYRARYPDPDTRYMHVLKSSKIQTNPRFRVMSQVLMFLKASNANPTTKTGIPLTNPRRKSTKPAMS
jgi:hypothetical protein